MRINWKVLLAVALIGATAFWAFTSVRAQSYTGTSLDFRVGRGPVTVTNPSDAPVSVQLAGTGSRSFQVASTTEGIAGASTREGGGSSQTQVFNFVLPAGVSAFTVTGGTNVTFLSAADTRLSATVQPASETDARLSLLGATLVILGALFYISRTTGHLWLPSSRRRQAAQQAARERADIVVHGQGPELQSYGDNRVRQSN
jgi:hypothetical protein